MSSWTDVVIALIAGLPASIAAVSSIRNGREQQRVRSAVEATHAQVQEHVNGSKPSTNGRKAGERGGPVRRAQDDLGPLMGSRVRKVRDLCEEPVAAPLGANLG